MIDLVSGSSLPTNATAKKKAPQVRKFHPKPHRPPTVSHHNTTDSGQMHGNKGGIINNEDILNLHSQTASETAGKEALQEPKPQSNSENLPGHSHTSSTKVEILRADEIDKLLSNTATSQFPVNAPSATGCQMHGRTRESP